MSEQTPYSRFIELAEQQAQPEELPPGPWRYVVEVLPEDTTAVLMNGAGEIIFADVEFAETLKPAPAPRATDSIDTLGSRGRERGWRWSDGGEAEE